MDLEHKENTLDKNYKKRRRRERKRENKNIFKYQCHLEEYVGTGKEQLVCLHCISGEGKDHFWGEEVGGGGEL
jgi:hypothetical protein